MIESAFKGLNSKESIKIISIIISLLFIIFGVFFYKSKKEKLEAEQLINQQFEKRDLQTREIAKQFIAISKKIKREKITIEHYDLFAEFGFDYFDSLNLLCHLFLKLKFNEKLIERYKNNIDIEQIKDFYKQLNFIGAQFDISPIKIGSYHFIAEVEKKLTNIN